MKYQVKEGLPTSKEYCDLRILCGLSPKKVEHAEIALPLSIYSVTVRDGQKLIGMGRLIGDVGCFVQVVDIAVDPNYQGEGLGRLIMERVMGYVKDKIPRSCWVNLFADVDYLYQKFGFVPSDRSKGMYLDWDRL